MGNVVNKTSDVRTFKRSDGDINLVTTIIRQRHSNSLRALLKKKSIDVLHCYRDGWYPLHEAINLCYLDIVKLIVKFASKHNVDIISNWDQTMSLQRKYEHSIVSSTFPLKNGPFKPQTPFLVLAVQTKNLELIQFVRRLYKYDDDQSPLSYRANHKLNRGIFEAIILSFTEPKIMRFLLKAFPKYINFSFNYHMPDSFCQILRYASLMKMSFVIRELLRFSLGLEYDLERTEYSTSSLDVVGKFCLDLASEINDTTIMQILLDIISFKSTNLSNYQVLLFMRDILQYSCERSSVTVVEFLVQNGFNIYDYCLVNFRNEMFGVRDYDNRARNKEIDCWYRASALYWAARNERLDVLKYLISVVDRQKFRDFQLTSPVVAAAIAYSATCLELLFECGYCFGMDQNLPFSFRVILEYCLFHKKLSQTPNTLTYQNKSTDSLKILLKWGALELAVNQHGSTKLLKHFLENQWFCINEMLNGHGAHHPRIAWISRSDLQSYMKNFKVFLQHISLFKIVDEKNLDECVPSLQQLCRFVIRCCVVQKSKTLKPMGELNLSSLVLNYLWH